MLEGDLKSLSESPGESFLKYELLLIFSFLTNITKGRNASGLGVLKVLFVSYCPLLFSEDLVHAFISTRISDWAKAINNSPNPCNHEQHHAVDECDSPANFRRDAEQHQGTCDGALHQPKSPETDRNQ